MELWNSGSKELCGSTSLTSMLKPNHVLTEDILI